MNNLCPSTCTSSTFMPMVNRGLKLIRTIRSKSVNFRLRLCSIVARSPRDGSLICCHIYAELKTNQLDDAVLVRTASSERHSSRNRQASIGSPMLLTSVLLRSSRRGGRRNRDRIRGSKPRAFLYRAFSVIKQRFLLFAGQTTRQHLLEVYELAVQVEGLRQLVHRGELHRQCQLPTSHDPATVLTSCL